MKLWHSLSPLRTFPSEKKARQLSAGRVTLPPRAPLTARHVWGPSPKTLQPAHSPHVPCPHLGTGSGSFLGEQVESREVLETTAPRRLRAPPGRARAQRAAVTAAKSSRCSGVTRGPCAAPAPPEAAGPLGRCRRCRRRALRGQQWNKRRPWGRVQTAPAPASPVSWPRNTHRPRPRGCTSDVVITAKVMGWAGPVCPGVLARSRYLNMSPLVPVPCSRCHQGHQAPPQPRTGHRSSWHS